jgi:hypothetical protein
VGINATTPESTWRLVFQATKAWADSFGLEWTYELHDFVVHITDVHAANDTYVRGLERIIAPTTKQLEGSNRQAPVIQTVENLQKVMALDANTMLQQELELKLLRWKLSRANEKLMKLRRSNHET